MSRITATSWGHPDRHYAAPAGVDRRSTNGALPGHAGTLAPAAEERYWAALLERAHPNARETVERAYKQWNAVLRDYLRDETALRLTVEGKARPIPVRVVSGMPLPFAAVLKRFSEIAWLLLNGSLVESAGRGIEFLKAHLGDAERIWPEPGALAQPAELQSADRMAGLLLKRLGELKAVEQIAGIQEDVLGAYFFHVPEVRLYWLVIGIVAATIDVSVESLTVVVLAHELAHAYTHLGCDIDGDEWRMSDFTAADKDIVEGLAQFYTQVLCQRLEARFPAALQAYHRLLERQSGPYKAHIKWVGASERGGEIVRAAMIECRSTGIIDAEEFSDAIARFRNQVKRHEKPKPRDPDDDDLLDNEDDD